MNENVKCKVFKYITLPTLLYCCESWVLFGCKVNGSVQETNQAIGEFQTAISSKYIPNKM